MKKIVKEIINNLPKLKTSFAKLSKKDVLVGVPSDTSERKDDEGSMNNATIAYIQDNGSPAANIPARPFMVPGIEGCKDKLSGMFKKGAQEIVEGNDGAIEASLTKAGLIAQASIRNKINEGIPPPLADSTLKARIRSGKAVKGAKAELKSRYEGNPPSMSNAKPLIQTGQLRNSISFVVRNK